MADFLDVRNLSIAFHGNQVVNNVSFKVPAGRTVALVGESGSGKSVTALSILRLLDERHATYPTGEIHLEGENLLRAKPPRMRQIRGRRISMIFQEPMTSLNPLHTVEKQIGETLALHQGMRPNQARKRTVELLSLVGIPDPEQRLNYYPHQLSGGQKQRIMIAMALANEPDLLIADEPTTALDVTVQRQVLELLRDLQARMGMAVLLITHDLSIVRHYADDVVVMQQGHVMEAGPTSQIFKEPDTSYTRMLLNADPGDPPPPVAGDNDTLLRMEGVNVRFPITKDFLGRPKTFLHAVNDVSLTLRTGETLGIVGESGSGKTTLGMALLKLTQCDGRIHFEDRSIGELNQRQFKPLRGDIQIVFQDPYGSLSPRMSVGEVVGEGLDIHFPDEKHRHEEMIIQALTDVGLDPETRHRYPHEFSGGQRQRIAIARALVLHPKLIVLDEPTSALDRTVQKQVIELLRSLQQRYGLSYLFISHDLAVVRALSHRVLVLKSGQVVEYGEAKQVLGAPQADYTRQLLEAAFFYQGKPDESIGT
ncbi:ABC transporter ATP-binding protein [Marinobacter nanhaiticus D15-8W]|uniref:ABC-type dipeptide transporter n=1 Tax=Marinobacter nanhaiticus D15-8W TaxID=626887 RepID=N6WRN9_9GAMM|nr:ABC transporter ATP-binding protein [Marinobacter nanhaiticus]ENO14201.1 ABC transporter ATP-binding protein [Marinobacter nanhaiticus D15-8W]BES71588.1 ABC transporter ATP-binding protein [Marinobacter nanhaiticus D15-8W]